MPDCRAMTPDDLPRLGELLDLVFRAPRQITDQHVLTDFPLVFCPDNLSRCRVVELDGQIVSHASLWPRELRSRGTPVRVAGVTTVATHPDYRRRGLAVELMHDLHRVIEQEQIELGILWTAIPEFYERLGWRVIETEGWLVTCAQRLPISQPTGGGSIEPFDAARDLVELIELHEREPFRFTRTQRQYEILTALPKVQTLVVRRADRVAAYLVYSRAVNKPGVIEYAGSTEDVGALVSHISQHHALDEQTPWLIYHPRADLLQWATEHGMTVQPLPSSKGPGTEMVYVPYGGQVDDEVIRNLFVWGLDHF